MQGPLWGLEARDWLAAFIFRILSPLATSQLINPLLQRCCLQLQQSGLEGKSKT